MTDGRTDGRTLFDGGTVAEVEPVCGMLTVDAGSSMESVPWGGTTFADCATWKANSMKGSLARSGWMSSSSCRDKSFPGDFTEHILSRFVLVGQG